MLRKKFKLININLLCSVFTSKLSLKNEKREAVYVIKMLMRVNILGIDNHIMASISAKQSSA